MNRPEILPLPDVQARSDTRDLAIDRVGIRRLRYPMQFADDGSPPQPTVGTFNVYVALRAEQKGTHMSRLVAVIDEMRDPVTIRGLPALLDSMLLRLDAVEGRIEIDFPWFLRKTAPVSGVPSMMDFEVKLRVDHSGGARTITLTVVVPVMSLCPSSKAISDYGAHNQRSHLTLTLRPRAGGDAPSLAQLIAVGEDAASCELYGLLKRADEKYVTERAYDRPRFVEDLARGIAARLASDDRIEAFSVAAENFESIHNHSAYAEIVHGL